MTMVTRNRWFEAQAYEKSYWQNLARQISAGSQSQLDWYAWKAKMMEQRLEGYLNTEQKARVRVLEVGSGPIGIVTYLNWGERYTLDPLESYYGSDSTLSKLRSQEVKYGSGSGEKLPFDGEMFGVVILDNVLDHVHQAPLVLQEIGRVLAKDGLFYMAVNIHTTWGGILHRILSKLKIDRGHPYTFTVESIRRFLEQHGFMIKNEFVNSYQEAKYEDMRSSSVKARTKAYTGLSEFVYHAVCVRTVEGN
jgi:ubiquinone/menaquinone biosynthesis C-methylase UbiE